MDSLFFLACLTLVWKSQAAVGLEGLDRKVRRRWEHLSECLKFEAALWLTTSLAAVELADEVQSTSGDLRRP